MRNLLAGSNGSSTGFVSGASGKESDLANSFMARPDWTSNPQQIVQYASCHDNYTLMDKLVLSTGKSKIDSDLMKMSKLTGAIYLMSQGVPFIHAGEEFFREKIEEDGTRCENSYNAPDSVNHIEWSVLANSDYAAASDYYQGLIEFRKAHSALRLSTADAVYNNVYCNKAQSKAAMFTINGGVNGEIADKIIVLYNANNYNYTFYLPSGTWKVCVDANNAGTEVLYTASGNVTLPGISAMVLIREAAPEVIPQETAPAEQAQGNSGKVNVPAILGGAAAAAAAVAAVAYVLKKKKK
jgi:pullulanase